MAPSCKLLAGFVVLAAGLAACGSEEPVIDDTPGETTVVYSCENGRGFSATFTIGRESVQVLIDGQTLELVQIPAQSGVAYSNGQLIFHTEGLTAFTQGHAGGDYTGCTGSNT